MHRTTHLACAAVLLAAAILLFPRSALAQELPGTKELTTNADLATEMVAGIDRFLDRELERSVRRRARYWHPDFSSPEAYSRSVAANRDRFRQIIGVVDQRPARIELELVATVAQSAVVGDSPAFTVLAVRWPALAGVSGEGLLLRPKAVAKVRIIAIPDADQTPEMLAGLQPGIPPAAQFARRLAENGCEVLIPVLIDRADTWSGNSELKLMTNQPHREFIYRMAFEMGRHIIGYEVQKILAAVDYFRRFNAPVGVIGFGEGGLLALYSGAADARIDAVGVSGYFQSRQELWREPIYRNVWGLLDEFGDAELAGLIAPRPLIIEAARGPEISGPPPEGKGSTGAAPGRLISPPFASVQSEFLRARGVYQKLDRQSAIQMVGNGAGLAGSSEALQAFLAALGIRDKMRAEFQSPRLLLPAVEAAPRLHRQFDELVGFTQRLVRQSERRRAEFMRDLVASPPEQRDAVAQRYRNYLDEEVIGRFPAPTLPINARSRLAYDEPNWRGYEVALDVWPDVFAYGILLVPKDLKAGERRPLVVCQHGLESRPQKLADPKIESIYHSFAAQLADRGFVTFAPQNPYIGGDRFRTLQRKLNPLGKSLFSVITRQHERILEWLAQLPFVDPARIGFYGLSYGGKTAMRVPALLPQYALSICSGDFNEWVGKTTNIDQANSYMFSKEYEIPEFNLGNTFGYAEMAALIAPRPLMVERGHQDGVGSDEWVAYEFAKARKWYLKFGVGDRARIEFFDGRHEIHGQGTFEFLHEMLRWPKR